MKPTQALPKYLEIKTNLIAQIKTGDFCKAEMLPTEKELCSRYGVSRITIRKTLDELKKEGYVSSRPGFGTKINHHKEDLSAFTLVESFTSEMKEYGSKIKTIKASLTIVYADEERANEMRCETGDKLYNLKRVRGDDKGPIVYSDTWLRLPFDLPSTQDFLYGSLYQYLIEKGLYFSRFEECLSAQRSTAAIEEMLRQEENGIVLKRVRRGYDANKHMIELTDNFYNPERYSYEVEVDSIHKF